LNNIVAAPDRDDLHPETVPSEKAWTMGYSIITVRTLAKSGWIEVLVRRPSGFTKFLCRAENVPMVRPGDVDPDFVSGPAGMLMERDYPNAFPFQSAHPPSSSAQCKVRLDS
jgi:tuberous sclerosis protein 2